MSNKSQLQTNNTNLDALISRVNAAKNTAASLPEAGGDGAPATYTLDGSYLLKKDAVYDGSNFTEPLELTFMNDRGDPDHSVATYIDEYGFVSAYSVSRITLNSERFEIYMPIAEQNVHGWGLQYIDASGWYQTIENSEAYRIIEFYGPVVVPKTFYDVFTSLLETNENITPHTIGYYDGKAALKTELLNNYGLDIDISAFIMNNTSAGIQVNDTMIYPYEAMESLTIQSGVAQLIVAPTDYDFTEIVIYWIPYSPEGYNFIYDQAQRIEPLWYVKHEEYGMYSGVVVFEMPLDYFLLIISEELIPELEQ